MRAEGEGREKMKTLVWCSVAIIVALAVFLSAWPASRPEAQPPTGTAVQIDADDIGGVVSSKSGPEAVRP